ncbi:MAG: dihydrofolate reductase [Bacteroidota bacterium]
MIISIVVATGKNGEIGKDNRLLWHLPADLKYFKNLTTGHPIIMGRHTFESIGKALPNRRNIIITRQNDYQANGVDVVHSLEDAINLVKDQPEIMVIGGADVYNQALPIANRIYITRVDIEPEADRYFPELDPDDWNIHVDIAYPADDLNVYSLTFQMLERKQ